MLISQTHLIRLGKPVGKLCMVQLFLVSNTWRALKVRHLMDLRLTSRGQYLPFCLHGVVWLLSDRTLIPSFLRQRYLRLLRWIVLWKNLSCFLTKRKQTLWRKFKQRYALKKLPPLGRNLKYLPAGLRVFSAVWRKSRLLCSWTWLDIVTTYALIAIDISTVLRTLYPNPWLLLC